MGATTARSTGALAPRTVRLAALVLILSTVAIALALQRSGDREGTSAAGATVAEIGRAEHPPPPPPPAPPRLPRAELWNNGKPREVYAAWYEVPDDSLAKHRAGAEEFTAAHNRLPIGTLVRVTNLKNGKSTVVRITDRGIRDRKIKLDVCKEAAEQLGMVTKGVARVRMQVLEETSGASLTGSQNAASQP